MDAVPFAICGRGLGTALLVLLPAPALAQTLITSPASEATQVTLYRDPDRVGPMAGAAAGRTPGAADLRGFALVTERRTITVPAGPAVVRFEGVAGNILPESAIVAGLPADVRERNMDADLLSPRTLYDRSLGRRVLIRRTDRATGRVREEQAVIRSSAAGAGVVTLATGAETLRCSGLPERIVYLEAPPGLSAKPTLSIRTDSPRPVAATVTLSYLAGGFDWQADYTLTVRPDGRADLFAWVTLASGDVTSFPDAEVAAVAGRLNRDEEANGSVGGRQAGSGRLAIRCWPIRPDYARHRDLAESFNALPPPPPPPPPPAPVAMARAEGIIVTGSRVARQEELGDLKLYRFPDRVTVASQSQKQVAMLDRRSVPVAAFYRTDLDGGSPGGLQLVLRLTNRKADNLGLPLPAGPVAVFESAGGRPMLLGTPVMADKAVDEEVELTLEPGPSVAVAVTNLDDSEGPGERKRLTISNANPFPIRYEARIRIGDGERLRAERRLVRRDGRSIWSVTVPANGRATLDYSVTARR